MLKGFRNRLSYRLTRNTVLIAMALGLALNVVQITLDYFSAREAMSADIEALMEISHNPAAQIAYNIDVRLAGELLDGLLHHPATIDARIVEDEDDVMAAASKDASESPYRWISDRLFGSRQVFSRELRVEQLNNLTFGRLVVTIDTYHYGLQFLKRSGYTVVSGLFKSLILSISLLGIFYVILTRPMLSVINALSEVRASSPEKVRLPVPRGHQQDEIGTMVGIINQHLETIDSTLARLRSAESNIKNYSIELEHEVLSRTQEISDKNSALQQSNRALVKAKEDAMRRARARASFLAGMSHEIRTPLNGLLGMLGLALDNEQNPDKRHRLEIALSAGESLLGILNDILDISKVEAGKLYLENIPFELPRIIEECTTLHGEQARIKGIELTADIAPGFPDQLLGDPTRIRQVLNNLISNAIKFTETGRVQVAATYSADSVTLTVTDTGIGLSQEGIRRLFAPFAQADTQTTRLYGGTGLGLALCRQLIERMHGQITVDSKEQEGTIFTVTLPLPVFQETDTDTGEAHAGPAVTPTPSATPSLRVLLVEDNKVNQMVASSLLKKMGHHPEVAANGQIALEALAQSQYDLILMDCQMPVMDGYETTRRIRQNPDWQNLPIIAVTANVMQGDKDDCFACGMNDYITKPYNRHRLREMISRWAPIGPSRA